MARRTGSKFFGWGAGTVAVLLVLLATAPFIVAGTSYRDRAVAYALGKYPGEVQTGSASFNWFVPISLKNVKAYDAAGDLLFAADEIATERSLWSLAWNSTDVGGVTFTRPELFLSLRQDGSNLEDVLAAMSEGDSGAGPNLNLEIVDGKIYVSEAESGEEYQLDKVKLQASLPSDPIDPIAAKFAASLVDGGGWVGKAPAGVVEGELLWQRDPRGQTHGDGEAALRCEKAPLELAQPILRRLGIGLRPAGELTADVRYAWEKGGARQDLEIRDLRTGKASVATTGLLAGEPVDLSNLTSHGRMLVEGERVEFREVSVQSDFVRVDAGGSTRLASLTSSDMLAALQEDDLKLTGEIDLAKLVRSLPKSLGLETNGSITSGKATFSLTNEVVGEEKRWRFDAKSDKWTMVSDGKVVTWEAPIEATALFGAEGGSIVVEGVDVKSDVVTLQGRGSRETGEFVLTGDLDRLHERLSQIVSSKDLSLAGKIDARGAWNLSPEGEFAANADATLTNLEFAAPGYQAWKEPKLTLSAKAGGVGDATSLKTLSRGELIVEAGADSLKLTLAKPVERPFEAKTFPVGGTFKGSLAGWSPRVQAWLPTSQYAVEGSANATFDGQFGADRIEFTKLQASIANLVAKGPSVNLDEPQVQAELVGAYDLGTGELAVKTVTTTSSSIAFRGSDVQLRLTGKSAGMQGELAWRGDLSRMSGWFENPDQPPSGKVFGTAVGNLDVKTTAEGTKILWEGQAEQFVWASRRRSPLTGTLVPASAGDAWEPIWSEPVAKLKGEALWTPASDSLAIDSCFVTTETLAFAASGKIDELSKRAVVDVAGQTELNLPRISDRLKPLVADDLAMTGGSAKPFTLKGPLRGTAFAGSTIPGGQASDVVPMQLAGSAAIDWNSLRLFGFQAGAGGANVTLRQGIVAAEGIDLPVSEGRLRVYPRIDLNASPPALVVERGTVLEQVRITPEMCRGWLKYAAPIVADATEAQGTFSVAIQETSIPLADPAATETQGALQIHSAQIGPGPLGRQLVSIAKQVEALVKKQPFNPSAPVNQTWVVIPEQEVLLQMAGSRIYHERMLFRVGDVELTTTGSVGVDQTLQLVVEAPIRNEWIDRDPSLAVLRGQTLKIPVRGTVDAPQVDPSALKSSATALLGGAAQNLLQTELEKQLNKGIDKLENAIPGLFRPRP